MTFQKARTFINSTMRTSVIGVWGGGWNLLCIVFTKLISDVNVKSRYAEMRDVREDICIYTSTIGVRVHMRAQLLRV